MPENDFSLTTEYDSYSQALIVDEIGEASTVLVDKLLGHGCLVYYWGKETCQSFHYLSGKNNFIYLNSLEEAKEAKSPNYIFYFPHHSLDKLPEIISLSQKNQGKILICHNLDFPEIAKEKALLEEKEKSNLKIVVFDCLFGPRIREGVLGEIFAKAVRKEPGEISWSAEEEIYPISARKLIEEATRLIFSGDSSGKIYFFQTEKISISSFIDLLKKFLPESLFVFRENSSFNKLREIENENFQKILVDENLEEEIGETCEWFFRNKETKIKDLDFLFPEETKETKGEEKKPRFFKKFFLSLFLFLFSWFLFLGLPFLFFCVSGIIGTESLFNTQEDIEKGNFSSLVGRTQGTEKLFDVSQKLLFMVAPFYSIAGLGRPLEEIQETIHVLQNINRSIKYTLSSSSGLAGVSKIFFGEEEGNWVDSLGPVKTDLSLAYQEASLAQALLAKPSLRLNFLENQQSLDELKNFLTQTRGRILKFKTLITFLPEILGVGERRTYLLLLQNNLELRPTGGFINAYGIINLENGKFINFETFDVYKADSLLKGKVEPPPKIREYLGETTWYLRDSNWDVDFPTSAKKAAWFLDKETQQTPDGVVAVNLNVFKEILSVLGEVQLPLLDETVDKGNLLVKVFSLPETGGSLKDEKENFFGDLAKAIFEKIKKADEETLMRLGKVILSLLEEKEMMMFFNDSQIQAVAGNLGWEGGIRSYHSERENYPVFEDYLFINEANVGINKVNYYVERRVDHKITISENGEVTEKLTIEYENKSPSETWPAGRYKNYLRIFLPVGAGIDSVLMTETENSELWIPFNIKQLDKSYEYNKAVFGLLLDVPPKTKKKIEVNYHLAQKLDFLRKLNSYLLMVQKQSGIPTMNYNLTVLYPSGQTPLRVLPKAQVSENQLLVSEKLDRDKVFQIDLGR